MKDPQSDTGRMPLAAAIEGHLEKNRASFHTPGHKGRAPFLNFLASLPADLTELPDTGSLYDGQDAIEAAEARAARAFGAQLTLFSGGGCTLCIQTMLLLGAGAGGRVLMARNAHRSAVHAAALLGQDIVWLWPEESGQGGFPQPAAADVENALKTDPSIRAVYVTSPDYYGRLCDIEGMAAACARAGIPLLVDNAHGSHLGAFGRHPLALGATMTADSAHKTLPVLTGGAYLHISARFPVTRTEAKAAMALFGSTSPAFPVLASLDAARQWWETEGKDAYRALAARSAALREEAAAAGVVCPAFSEVEERLRDPVRLTLDGAPGGLAGDALADWLRTQGCEPEYADARYVVLIPTPFNRAEDWERLTAALRALPAQAAGMAKQKKPAFDPYRIRPRKACTLREALLRPAQTVPAAQAAGRIAARTVCPCPPGVAAVVPGEKLTASLAEALESAGFAQLVVLKNL